MRLASDQHGGTSKVTVTVPNSTLGQIDQMAEGLGRSRSSVLSSVLAAALTGDRDHLARYLSPRAYTRTAPRQAPNAVLAVLHTPTFKTGRGRPRADGVRYGYGACSCGWVSKSLVREQTAMSYAGRHVAQAQRR